MTIGGGRHSEGTSLPVTGLIKTPDDSSSLSNKKYIC